MSTPLQVRERRREAQRTVRLALNDLNRGLDEWKKAITEGKACALKLTNEILTARHIAEIPLAGLEAVPNLRQCALRKCARQIVCYVNELEQIFRRLEEGLVLIDHAVHFVQTLGYKEVEDCRLSGRPVFRDFSLDTIADTFTQIADAHSAELTVKRCVVSDFKSKSEETVEEIKEITASMGAMISNGPRVEKWTAEATEALESFLQVHITAWMLNTKVNDDLVAHNVEMMTQDVKSC